MQISSTTTANGVTERSFTVDDVPGLFWSPADTAEGRPLVLLAHGGGQHKQDPGVLAHAHRFVAAGFLVAAIDQPGHGDRPRIERHGQLIAAVQERAAAGEPIGPQIARFNAELAEQAVPEWQSVLTELLLSELVGAGAPVGFRGVSMGAAVGARLVAAEPRIRAAVLGLVAYELLAEAAAGITVPVQFLLQWDDELVPRESGLALFDAIASSDKTLHANPGGHRDLPRHEIAQAEAFFTRHLVKDPGSVTV